MISQSKPFGGYYQRAGAVFCRNESPSLFGNQWFKNLLSLSWATAMMRNHDVHELPRRYRQVQEEAARAIGERLILPGLEATDVMVLATASAPEPADSFSPLHRSVLRGTGKERVIRLCLTPAMSALVDPRFAWTTLQRHPELVMGQVR